MAVISPKISLDLSFASSMHTEYPRFYFPDYTGEDQALLRGDEVLHISKVLRMDKDDEFLACDGHGGIWRVSIRDIKKDRCTIELIEQIETQDRRSKLHIAIAPTKNIDRTEWFIEKATEIGIGRLTPLICKRSERKVVKVERLKKIAVSAMKQSQRSWLPLVDEALSLSDFLKQEDLAESRYIAHCIEGLDRVELDRSSDEMLILIGPEGDFDEQELQLTGKSGFLGLSLGPQRLRTETAALVACMRYNL